MVLSTQSQPLHRSVNQPANHAALAARYGRVRAQSLALAAPLSAEDCQAQSMPDASPVKWHLAHVTWFFETLVLEAFEPGFTPYNPAFRVLFNSYYNAVGDKHPRAERGLLTRPSLAEVIHWREAVDARVLALLAAGLPPGAGDLIELGLQHEQQHQELLLTDVKHLLSRNSLGPIYRKAWPLAAVAPVAHSWVGFEGGLVQIGVDASEAAFAFDNESPRHGVYLRPYALGNRLVTHGEWLDFMQDGGYADPRWWLSAGWDWAQRERIQAPLYWRRLEAAAQANGADWRNFTLHGDVPIDPHTPVTHISYYEADAFARWKAATDSACAGARLPTEAEWEAAVARQTAQQTAQVMVETTAHTVALAHWPDANFVESAALHPMPVARPPKTGAPGLQQAFGDCWEWTSSSYAPYPGYQPWGGTVGEYNGKFMVNQYVLRGGSCATPADHIRASYRNFFPAEARWQFSGLRLARDVD